MFGGLDGGRRWASATAVGLIGLIGAGITPAVAAASMREADSLPLPVGTSGGTAIAASPSGEAVLLAADHVFRRDGDGWRDVLGGTVVGGAAQATDLTVLPDDSIVVADGTQLLRIPVSGAPTVLATLSAQGLSVDNQGGDVYVDDGAGISRIEAGVPRQVTGSAGGRFAVIAPSVYQAGDSDPGLFRFTIGRPSAFDRLLVTAGYSNEAVVNTISASPDRTTAIESIRDVGVASRLVRFDTRSLAIRDRCDTKIPDEVLDLSDASAGTWLLTTRRIVLVSPTGAGPVLCIGGPQLTRPSARRVGTRSLRVRTTTDQPTSMTVRVTYAGRQLVRSVVTMNAGTLTVKLRLKRPIPANRRLRIALRPTSLPPQLLPGRTRVIRTIR